MAKSANLYARIEPEVKDEAERILAALGISASSAINMFYKQIILRNGIPFDVTIPARRGPDFSVMTANEVNVELEKGYIDMKEGRVKSAEQIFKEIRKDREIEL